MLFKVMSQTLSIKEFGEWLYHDSYVKSQLLENEMIFELLNIDLSSKHAFYELEKFCFSRFNKDECLVQVIKHNCEIYLERQNDEAATIFFKNNCYFHDWNDDYKLLHEIDYLAGDWELVNEGFIDKQFVKTELFNFVQMFLVNINGMNTNESISYLNHGLQKPIEVAEETSNDSTNESYRGPATEINNNSNKKWFEFWK